MDLYGQPVEWSETNEGHHAIYEMAPHLVPIMQVARVIYELRLDVERLNTEAIEAHTRLQKQAQDHVQAQQGVSRCECGCKYWVCPAPAQWACADCGERFVVERHG